MPYSPGHVIEVTTGAQQFTSQTTVARELRRGGCFCVGRGLVSNCGVGLCPVSTPPLPTWCHYGKVICMQGPILHHPVNTHPRECGQIVRVTLRCSKGLMINALFVRPACPRRMHLWPSLFRTCFADAQTFARVASYDAKQAKAHDLIPTSLSGVIEGAV